jgi:hypothetical protein
MSAADDTENFPAHCRLSAEQCRRRADAAVDEVSKVTWRVFPEEWMNAGAEPEPPRPLSLRLPSRKSADHRPYPKARTQLAAGDTRRRDGAGGDGYAVPEPNLQEPNQTADLTLPPPPRTASRRPPHQDRDRGAGDGAGAGPARRVPGMVPVPYST